MSTVDIEPGAQTDYSQGTKTLELALTWTHYKSNKGGSSLPPGQRQWILEPGTNSIVDTILTWH